MTFSTSIRLLFTPVLVAAAIGGCGSSDASNPSPASEGGGACNNNGIAEGSEECDGPDFKGATCATKTMGTMPNGLLSCSFCRLVVQGCTSSSGGGGTPGSGGRPGLGGGVGTGGGP